MMLSSRSIEEDFVTLPPLQKHFVNFFSYVPGNCALKNAGIFGEFFLVTLVSVSHKLNEARKILKKFGENSERNSGQNPGQKFEKFGELSFCDFSDLRFGVMY